MGVLVHKIIARTYDRNLIRKVKKYANENHSNSMEHFVFQLKLLSQQILHRSPNFSFGLFGLDWSFVYTVSLFRSLVLPIKVCSEFRRRRRTQSPFLKTN